MIPPRPPRRSSRAGLLLASLAALGAACAPSETPSELGRMELVDVVRDLLFDPPEWEVVEAHPDLAPTVGVISPSARPWKHKRDGWDMPALVLAPPGEVRFTIGPDEGPAWLRCRAGIHVARERLARPGAGAPAVGFEVLVGGERAAATEVRLDPTRPLDGEWVDLGGPEGIPVSPGDVVTLRTRGGDGGSEPLRAGFGGLRIERPRTVPRTRATAERPNLVLVLMDTLRADRLSTYGYGRPTSPQLDRLAARGVVFENAYATSSWTWPSTASVLTGLQPGEHGVVKLGPKFFNYLQEDVRTVGEELQREGVTTAAFTGNPLISVPCNFDQGFELLDHDPSRFRKTGELFDGVERWVEENADVRFFLYLHLAEPHHPFEALPEALERFAPDVPPGFGERMGEIKAALKKGQALGEDGAIDYGGIVSEQELEWASDFFDATVWSGDHWLGRTLDLLERLDLDERTVVVFTNDHGQELFERGFMTHGHTLHGELVRAPFVVAGPGIPAGRRIEKPVSNAWIAPFLARLGGAEDADGFDLAALFAEGSDPEPVLYSTEIGFWNGRLGVTIHGMRLGDTVLHFAPDGRPWGADDAPGAADEIRLFDLSSDPREERDLSAARAEEASRLRALLERRFERMETLDDAPVLEGGEATRRMLEGIGYIGDE